jgi:hypothetical protein
MPCTMHPKTPLQARRPWMVPPDWNFQDLTSPQLIVVDGAKIRNLPYTDTIKPLPEGAIIASLTESFRSAIKASTFATVIFYHFTVGRNRRQERNQNGTRILMPRQVNGSKVDRGNDQYYIRTRSQSTYRNSNVHSRRAGQGI